MSDLQPESSQDAEAPTIGPSLSLVLRLIAPKAAGAVKRASADRRRRFFRNGDENGAQKEESTSESGSAESGSESDEHSEIVTVRSTPPSSPMTGVIDHDADKDDALYELDDLDGTGHHGYQRASAGNQRAKGSAMPMRYADSERATSKSPHYAGYYVRADIQHLDTTETFPPLRLHIDSATSITWAMAEGRQELHNNRSCTPHTDDPWVGHPRHQFVHGHGYSASSQRDVDVARHLRYADGCHALVVLPKDRSRGENSSRLLKLKTSFDCYDWGTRRWEKPIRMPYVFALAIAVNKKMDKDIFDGTLALGLGPTQGSYPNCDYTYRSILHALQDYVLEPELDHPVGITFYYGLRPIPIDELVRNLSLYDSFVGINRWPCPKDPGFSSRIHVMIDEDEVRRYDLAWHVNLTGMDLIDHDVATDSWAEPEAIKFPPTTLWKEGQCTLLDTGCSLSWVPEDVVMQIAAHYGTEYIPVTGGATQYPFIVPDHKHSPFHLVQLHFQASDMKSQVIVRINAEHFIYADNPHTRQREGLLFSRQEGSRRCVFGANFFHGAWVKMCAPRSAAPFVQLAMQQHALSSVQEYQLPPPNPPEQ